MESYNQLTPYLKQILSFIGITDVSFVEAGRASGVQYGKITAEQYLKPFQQQAAELAKA